MAVTLPTVSGRKFFDLHRTADATGSGMTGIANVPIVLQNMATGKALAVLTDVNGNFTFTDVPSGNYQLVEVFGYPTTAVGSGNFYLHGVIAPIITEAVTPPIWFATNPPACATHLDCTISCIRPITVGSANLTGQNFLNGPAEHVPEVKITKTASCPWTLKGGTIEFCIKMENTGAVDIANALFRDPLDSRFSYVDKSFTVDGGYQVPAIVEGALQYMVPLIEVGESVEICFKVRV